MRTKVIILTSYLLFFTMLFVYAQNEVLPSRITIRRSTLKADELLHILKVYKPVEVTDPESQEIFTLVLKSKNDLLNILYNDINEFEKIINELQSLIIISPSKPNMPLGLPNQIILRELLDPGTIQTNIDEIIYLFFSKNLSTSEGLQRAGYIDQINTVTAYDVLRKCYIKTSDPTSLMYSYLYTNDYFVTASLLYETFTTSSIEIIMKALNKNKYEFDVPPAGFAFSMHFPGTFYTWNTFGGNSEANTRTPYTPLFPRNYSPEILFYSFFDNSNDISDYKHIAYPEWGGTNRDLSASFDARLDLLDKWCFDYLNNANTHQKRGSEAIIMTGFSHGNQTAIRMFNRLSDAELLKKNTIYVAMSRPDRRDHQLSEKSLNILGKNFINIYNNYDMVIGARKVWYSPVVSGIDTFDYDMQLFNKVYDPYSKDAINFVLYNQTEDFYGNHCVPLSYDRVIEQILRFFKHNYLYLKKGEIYNVYHFKETGKVIIIPKELSYRNFNRINTFGNAASENMYVNRFQQSCLDFLSYYRINVPEEIKFFDYWQSWSSMVKHHNALAFSRYYHNFNGRYYLDYNYLFSKLLHVDNDDAYIQMCKANTGALTTIPIEEGKITYSFDYNKFKHSPDLYYQYKNRFFLDLSDSNYEEFETYWDRSDILRYFGESHSFDQLYETLWTYLFLSDYIKEERFTLVKNTTHFDEQRIINFFKTGEPTLKAYLEESMLNSIQHFTDERLEFITNFKVDHQPGWNVDMIDILRFLKINKDARSIYTDNKKYSGTYDLIRNHYEMEIRPLIKSKRTGNPESNAIEYIIASKTGKEALLESFTKTADDMHFGLSWYSINQQERLRTLIQQISVPVDENNLTAKEEDKKKIQEIIRILKRYHYDFRQEKYDSILRYWNDVKFLLLIQ